MFKTLSQKIVYKNPYFKVTRKKFETPDKIRGDFFILNYPESVIIIALKNGKLIMEKQYRFPQNKWSIELPAGGVKKTSTPLKSAKEELQEETGYLAQKIKKIGFFNPSPGDSIRTCHVYLADKLKKTQTKLEDTEYIDVVEIPIQKVYELAGKGKIFDGFTLAALAIAKDKLLKK